MFQKLEDVEKRYEDLTVKISDPEVIAQNKEWQKMMKEHAELTPIVEKYREYKKVEQSIKDSEEMLSDPDLKELAQEELKEAKERLPQIEEEINKYLDIRKETCDRVLVLSKVSPI